MLKGIRVVLLTIVLAGILVIYGYAKYYSEPEKVGQALICDDSSSIDLYDDTSAEYYAGIPKLEIAHNLCSFVPMPSLKGLKVKAKDNSEKGTSVYLINYKGELMYVKSKVFEDAQIQNYK